MNVEQRLKTAEELLAPWNKETSRPEENRLDVVIQAEDLREAASALHDAQWGYLSAITGMDLGVEAGQLEALYHFCYGPAITSLRIRLPRNKEARVPSIAGIIPPAVFFEREIKEMFGINIDGLSASDHLFLPEDWPPEVYPQRVDFTLEQAKAMEVSHVDEMPEPGLVGENTFVVPIGPQHPALKEPGHFEFTVDGEIVTAAKMR